MLKDGRETIFLSTRGNNDKEVSAQLRRFLQYTGGFLPPEDRDDYTNHLDHMIQRIKLDSEWKGKYMLLELTMQEQYKDGLEEGRKEGKEEGLETGRLAHLVGQCLKKLSRGAAPSQIATELEEDEDLILRICDAAEKAADDASSEKIAEYLINQLKQHE